MIRKEIGQSVFEEFKFSTTVKAFKDLIDTSKCFTFIFILKLIIYIYCSSLLILGYTNSPLIYNALLFVIINAVLSSILIVLSNFSKVQILLLSSLLFSLYLLSFSCSSKSYLKTPCRPVEVIGAEGTVLNDVSQTKSGNYIIKMKCRKVYLRSDVAISYSGELVILSKENYSLMRSSFVRCNLQYDEELNFYKGSNIRVYSIPQNFSFDKIKISDKYENLLWNKRFIRVNFRNWIYRNIKPTLARLLLLGRSDDDGFIFKEAALQVGCSHLLALSGMHLSYISTFFSFVPIFLLRKRKNSKKIGKRISIIFPVLFVLVAGALPSLVRALFMYFLSLVIRESELKRELIFLLSLSLQLLLFNSSIVEIGMLLSYIIIAVLSILNMLMQKTRLFKGAVLSTLAALLVSYPLGKLFGGSWSIAAVAVAPIATLMISISMLLSLLLLLNVLTFNVSIYLILKIFEEGIIYGMLNLIKEISNFLIKYLSDKIDNFEYLLKYIFNMGIRVPLYLPISLSGAKGYQVYCLTLLTISAVYLYSIAIIRFRRKRIYELEISIRFPKCN